MPIAYSDTEIYDTQMDEAVAKLPESIQRVYIDTRDAVEAPEKPAGEFKPTDVVYPTPYGLNPPERPVTPPADRPPAKVLFKTKTGVEITDHDIDNAINIVMSVGSGTMAGVTAKTMKNKMNALGGAQTLEAAGKNVDEIFAQTGMFRGTDGRWRFEIDDSTAGFDQSWINRPVKTEKVATGGSKYEQIPFEVNKGKVEIKLSEALDHPELYKAYPHLKDVKLVYDANKKGAHADFANNEIVMGKDSAQNLGVLMHEVQHHIQNLEGFAQGGVPLKATKEYKLKYQKDFEALRPEMENLISIYTKSIEGKGVITEKEVKRLKELSSISRKYTSYVNAADEQAGEYYMRLAGETESRNVDARLLLNEAERRSLHPRWTEDVNTKDQIISDEVIGTTAYGLKDSKGHVKKPK